MFFLKPEVKNMYTWSALNHHCCYDHKVIIDLSNLRNNINWNTAHSFHSFRINMAPNIHPLFRIILKEKIQILPNIICGNTKGLVYQIRLSHPTVNNELRKKVIWYCWFKIECQLQFPIREKMMGTAEISFLKFVKLFHF